MAATLDQRKRATAFTLAGIAMAMVGMSFAAVPLYRVFCSVTGYGGTTQRAEKAPSTLGSGRITVRFDASTAADLGWEFRPLQNAIAVRPGEQTLATYRAVNLTKGAVTGTATYNVTPYKAGVYFNKVQCFCFTKQHLEPGESADLTVAFFVDPELMTDPATKDVTTITLSYTMFHAREDGQPDTSAATAKPLAQRRDPAAAAQPSSVN